MGDKEFDFDKFLQNFNSFEKRFQTPKKVKPLNFDKVNLSTNFESLRKG